MTIYKSCRADFHYNDTVCENLVTDFKEENDIVQNEVLLDVEFIIQGVPIKMGIVIK